MGHEAKTEHEAKIEAGVQCVMANNDCMSMEKAIENFYRLSGDQGYDDAQCKEVVRVARERAMSI